MPLYLLRPGCWFRFQTALYEVIEYLGNGVELDGGLPFNLEYRISRVRLVGTEKLMLVNADSNVEPFDNPERR